MPTALCVKPVSLLKTPSFCLPTCIGEVNTFAAFGNSPAVARQSCLFDFLCVCLFVWLAEPAALPLVGFLSALFLVV